MSGQLVGEVIAASNTLRARGVSERGFQALIAIAEKANTKTRQASVRWDHIRDVQYGTSLSTAKRAVKELLDAGYVRKIQRGFNNQQGRSAAPTSCRQCLSGRTSRGRPGGHHVTRTGHPW